MALTVEQITAFGQSILDTVVAMPAEQRRFNPLANFLVAQLNALPEEAKAVLLDVLPKHIEEQGLIAPNSVFERMSTAEFMAAMNSGAISWGDLCLEAPQRKAKRVVEDRSLPFGWDLEIPQLKLRKDIWKNFPVIVEALGSGADGAERHAIRVHRKNWSEWRQTKAVDYDDWLNWDENTEFRLMKALESCRSWTVEESADPNTFAVIRMNFVPREELSSPTATAAPAPAAKAAVAEDGWTTVPARAAAVAVLTRINDITANFPTYWNNETTPRSSARRGDIISITIHNTKLRDAGLDRAKVERDLMAALRASSDWRVLAPAAGSREFCRLNMA